MDQDSTSYDSLTVRPLPKWLTDQRDGLNTVQIKKSEMKDDKTLQTSVIATGLLILIIISALTFVFLKKQRNSRFDE